MSNHTSTFGKPNVLVSLVAFEGMGRTQKYCPTVHVCLSVFLQAVQYRLELQQLKAEHATLQMLTQHTEQEAVRRGSYEACNAVRSWGIQRAQGSACNQPRRCIGSASSMPWDPVSHLCIVLWLLLCWHCDLFLVCVCVMQRPQVMGHEPVLPTPGVPRSLESEAERLAARVLKQSGVSQLRARGTWVWLPGDGGTLQNKTQIEIVHVDREASIQG